MRFEFAAPTKIVFGPGTLRDVPLLARDFGRRALVITGRDSSRATVLLSHLSAQQIASSIFAVPGEPSIGLVEEGARCAREAGCDFVIAMGGGSVIDAGKAIAALATNPGELTDYLEVVGKGKSLAEPPRPFIAIPTTAGTGTEVTRNAVLTSPRHQVKASLRSPLLPAKVAVIDPELTFSLPAALTASTGMDALTQLIEPFVSCRAHPMTDALCRDGMELAARSLPRAFTHPSDATARSNMALASLFSGLALANAGLGAVHGFAAPLGGMFPAPHGAVCAALLPHVMTVNLRALRERQPTSETLTRYREVAVRLTGRPDATADDGVAWVKKLCGTLEIPSLGKYGIAEKEIEAVCGKAAVSSSMKGNPLPLTTEELREILQRAL